MDICEEEFILLGAQITRETTLTQLQVKEAQVSQGSPCQKALEMNASLRRAVLHLSDFKLLAKPLTSSDTKTVY